MTKDKVSLSKAISFFGWIATMLSGQVVVVQLRQHRDIKM